MRREARGDTGFEVLEDARPAVLRFFDSFLQEKNIKWLLGTGALILLGSSLMLVTAHWQTYTPVWKYLVFLGYTAGTYGAARITYHSLGLRRTGTFLHALTVLLLPISFVALGWRHSSGEPLIADAVLRCGLFAGNLFFCALAASRVFSLLLRSPQPTFVACHVALCAMGTCAPWLGEWLGVTAAPWVTLLLWGIFTLGAVKVNRHVFWLNEERRHPRIMGFFPVALLGGQFLLLFAAYFAAHVPLHWMGVGAVLVGATVLQTSDALYRVFQQRTGNLVRPLPAGVILPMGLGLALIGAGLSLAAAGAASGSPHALVPAAALASGLLLLVARRTEKAAFTWAALLALTAAYQFSPVYFTDLARAIVDHGSQALHEQKLPYAFYGLTYLPLLGILLGWVARAPAGLRGHLVQPVRIYCRLLTLMLLALSFTHPKAVFPVGAALAGFILLEAIVFGDRRLVFLAIAACAAAVAGIVPFGEQVLGWRLPAGFTMGLLACLAGVLLGPADRLDPRLNAIAWPRGRWSDALGNHALCRTPLAASSAVLSVGVAAWWLASSFLRLQAVPGAAAPGWIPPLLLTVLLGVHALRSAVPGMGETTFAFLTGAAALTALSRGVTFAAFLSTGTVAFVVLWCAGYAMGRHPHLRISRAFGQAAFHTAGAALSAALAFVYVPLLLEDLLTTVSPGAAFLPQSWAGIGWVPKVLIVGWTFDAARRLPGAAFGVYGSLGALVLLTSATVDICGAGSRAWLPAVWTGAALAGLLLHRQLTARLGGPESVRDRDRSASLHAVTTPLYCINWAVLILIGIVSLGMYSWPWRVAGGLGLLGLLIFGTTRQSPAVRRLSLAIVNWQVLCLLLRLLCPGMDTILDVGPELVGSGTLLLGACAAFSLYLWEMGSPAWRTVEGTVAQVQRWILRVSCAAALLSSAVLESLDTLQAIAAAGLFAFLVAAEAVAACRDRNVVRVWIAEALVLATVGYFVLFGVITFGHGTSVFAVFGAAVVCWILASLSARSRSSEVLSMPLRQTAMALPLVAVGIGVGQHLLDHTALFAGSRSLATLLAAGFYFWRGLEGHSRACFVVSGSILNVALAMLWRELGISDPQFFMIPLGASILALVELMKKEIPQRWLDPLRYAGALTILVSPTFHIVGGSWLHLLVLMVASVTLILTAIGLRVRVILYSGTAFLAADIVAMVVRGSIDNPNLLWITGLAVGASVITLAAVCERHRETLQQKLRAMTCMLKQWS